MEMEILMDILSYYYDLIIIMEMLEMLLRYNYCMRCYGDGDTMLLL